MLLTESEWEAFLRGLEQGGLAIEAWPPDAPNVTALRCQFSRHRTLAHLRACQEIWFQAVVAFGRGDATSLTLLHPWRHFERGRYERRDWAEHKTAFLHDRRKWQEFLVQPGMDRTRGGRLNRQPHTIESLTRRLVLHEGHHLAFFGIEIPAPTN